MKIRQPRSHCLSFHHNLAFARLDEIDEKHVSNCSACREFQQCGATIKLSDGLSGLVGLSAPPWQQIKAKILENDRRRRREEILQRIPSAAFELKSAVLSLSLAIFLVISLSTITSNSGRVLSGQQNILHKVFEQLSKLPLSRVDAPNPFKID